MDFTSYESLFFEDNSQKQGPRRNLWDLMYPNMNFANIDQFCLTCMKFVDLSQYCLTCSEMLCTDCIKNHLSQNCHTCSLRTIKLTCAEVFQNLSTRIRLELGKQQKERQNVKDKDAKVKEWMERANASLKEANQTFADHLEKVFQKGEDVINKQANSVEIMKEVYEGRMLKGQMLLDGIHPDFNAPQNLAKAYRDSAAYTHKVDAFFQQKAELLILPDLDEEFPPPTPNIVAKVLAQATIFSYCSGLVKHEPCSPISDSGSSFKEFSPMKRKFNYDVNFGSFGVEDGQFSEPAGICVTAVTDTNNHRLQVFDEIGCLKLAFGVSGGNPGQMMYPNCIASCPVTGNYVITERPPVHQVQVYSSAGHFVGRFGQNLIQFPHGVTVGKVGNIIVVECKVMRLTIFDLLGHVIRTFCAPSIMSFPMGLCVNDNREIFFVDYRRHSVHVFDYFGDNLRSMCGIGTISFPITVGINAAGERFVTDNHQSMISFNQNGELMRSNESRNRHLQCLASLLMYFIPISSGIQDREHREGDGVTVQFVDCLGPLKIVVNDSMRLAAVRFIRNLISVAVHEIHAIDLDGASYYLFITEATPVVHYIHPASDIHVSVNKATIAEVKAVLPNFDY